ncbi:MAG: DegT/DnrJ/EryC1/StrS family aminotransferase [bacterium]
MKRIWQPRVQALIEEEMIDPPLSHRFRIWLQLKLYERFITPQTVQFCTHLYRKLSIMGLVVGSSTRSEYQGEVPENYFMGMTESQARKGVYEIERIVENISHRRMLAKFYKEELPKIGFRPVELREHEDPVFVRYPIRVRNKKEVLEVAYRERVEIGSWFESPLHPEGTDLQRFHYTSRLLSGGGESRSAGDQSAHPSQDLIAGGPERVLAFLQKFGEPVV